MADDCEDMNINEQLKRGLITFPQWLTLKNLEERSMLEALVEQGVLTEEQLKEGISAQKNRTAETDRNSLNIESDDQTLKNDQEPHKVIYNILI